MPLSGALYALNWSSKLNYFRFTLYPLTPSTDGGERRFSLSKLKSRNKFVVLENVEKQTINTDRNAEPREQTGAYCETYINVVLCLVW